MGVEGKGAVGLRETVLSKEPTASQLLCIMPDHLTVIYSFNHPSALFCNVRLPIPDGITDAPAD